MQTRVQKWGNSLAVRIPKSLSEQSRLKKNSLIEMAFEDGKIVINPARKKRKRTLDELLERVTKETMHDIVDWGRPVGKEVW